MCRYKATAGRYLIAAKARQVRYNNCEYYFLKLQYEHLALLYKLLRGMPVPTSVWLSHVNTIHNICLSWVIHKSQVTTRTFTVQYVTLNANCKLLILRNLIKSRTRKSFNYLFIFMHIRHRNSTAYCGHFRNIF